MNISKIKEKSLRMERKEGDKQEKEEKMMKGTN